MFIMLGGGWKMMALSIFFMLMSNGLLSTEFFNVYTIISGAILWFLFTKGQDGVHDIRESVEAFVARVREQGLAGALNFGPIHWQGNFNFFGEVGGAAGGGAGGVPRRAQPMTAEQVQLRVNSLPTEFYATDEELQTRSVKELKARLANRMIPRRQVDACLDRKDLIELLHSVSGSSASTCVICLEEYESGDAIRILPVRPFPNINQPTSMHANTQSCMSVPVCQSRSRLKTRLFFGIDRKGLSTRVPRGLLQPVGPNRHYQTAAMPHLQARYVLSNSTLSSAATGSNSDGGGSSMAPQYPLCHNNLCTR